MSSKLAGRGAAKPFCGLSRYVIGSLFVIGLMGVATMSDLQLILIGRRSESLVHIPRLRKAVEVLKKEGLIIEVDSWSRSKAFMLTKKGRETFMVLMRLLRYGD